MNLMTFEGFAEVIIKINLLKKFVTYIRIYIGYKKPLNLSGHS